MIILDTPVLQELLRPTPHYNVVKWLNEQDTYAFYLCAPVVAELFTEVAAMPAGEKQAAVSASLLGMLQEEFGERILPFDADCALRQAQLNAANRQSERPMSYPDAQIAAICQQHGATLATRNTQPFLHCGINLIDPWRVPTGHRLHQDAAEYYVMSRKS
ncbi:type II toxin-antitoxin system VapC family toxin [Gibbsiella dentisursi]|uniref:Ribonuclease VapC n=1 Tax=Gibbsiella dentisursi TaxID=796890 RepID=A0ABP7M4N3_9GAMM